MPVFAHIFLIYQGVQNSLRMESIKDRSFSITCEKNDQKVIVAYDLPRLQDNDFNVGVIDTGQPNNPPVFINIIFSEN